MNNVRIRFVLPLTLCSLLLFSCTASYSPFTNAPAKPLENDQLEIQAGYNPVSLYNSIGNIYGLSDGLFFGIRFGASDRITLGLGGWMESFDVISPPSGGGLMEALYLFGPVGADDRFRFGIHGRYSQLYAGDQDLVGHAVQVGGIVWTPMIWKFRPVISSEAAYGVRLDGATAPPLENAWLWTQSAALGYDLPLNFSIRGELVSIVHFIFPGHNDTGDVFWTGLGSLSLAWRANL